MGHIKLIDFMAPPVVCSRNIGLEPTNSEVIAAVAFMHNVVYVRQIMFRRNNELVL